MRSVLHALRGGPARGMHGVVFVDIFREFGAMGEGIVKRSIPAIMGGLLLAFLPTTQALGQGAGTYRSQIDQYQIRVDQTKRMGDTARYEAELSQIKSWIDESLILIGKDELSTVKEIVMKIGVYVDFVEASMARDKAMGEALEAESKLKSLKSEYGALEAQVQQMTAEKDLLQKQLDELQASKAKKQ